jgi:hypothetical protein
MRFDMPTITPENRSSFIDNELTRRGIGSKTIRTSQLITDILADYSELKSQDPLAAYGIRVLGRTEKVKEGGSLRQSNEWRDGVKTRRKYPGTAVFSLVNGRERQAVETALGYNLGTHNQRLALVHGDEFARTDNPMPEANAGLIKNAVARKIYNRPDELANVFDVNGVRNMAGAQANGYRSHE